MIPNAHGNLTSKVYFNVWNALTICTSHRYLASVQEIVVVLVSPCCYCNCCIKNLLNNYVIRIHTITV